ncbi:MAG: type II CAAX endopeptidase family protein [Verrucomicrobiota bacterium]
MMPEKTWRTDSVLRLLLGIFATWSAGILLAGALVHFGPAASSTHATLLSMVIVTMAFHGASLFWIKAFLKSENISWPDAFGFNQPAPGRALGWAVLVAVVVLPVAWGLQQLSSQIMVSNHLNPEPQQMVQEIQKGGISTFQQVYLGFITMIAAPVVEEIIFRGIVYPTIKRAGYPKVALWGTSILFSFTHQNTPAFLSLVFFAVILTLLYEETGNLLAPIVAHSCFNATNLIMLLVTK